MTREEAERELRDEPGYRIEPDRPDYEMMPWREIAITERLARREAEARVEFLDSAVDAAIADRDYYNKKLEQAEAERDRLAKFDQINGETLAEMNRVHKTTLFTNDELREKLNKAEARVKELEDEIGSFNDALRKAVDHWEEEHTHVKELEELVAYYVKHKEKQP